MLTATLSQITSMIQLLNPLIVKYRNHPSILKIGEVCNRKLCSRFCFSHVDKEEILKEILSLDSTKVSQDTDIPTKFIKDNADIFSDFLLSGFNNSILTSIFPLSLKQAIITPVFKKGDKNSKENYRPVSILPNTSKKFQRLLFKQISNSWNLSSQNNSVVLVKATARRIAFYPYLKNGNQWSIKENILVHF